MLGIETMRVADGALREGLLYDLLGRLTDEDARVRSVRAMEARFHVETAQADRVEATALAFLRQVRDDWELDEPLAELVLRWAARLHEVGLDIAHSHYQRHGAYLLQNADMPGFPREEQQLLAAIVGGHRRKLHLDALDDLMPPWHLKALYLIVLLRLAVLLHRGRGPRSLPEIDLRRAGARRSSWRFRAAGSTSIRSPRSTSSRKSEYLRGRRVQAARWADAHRALRGAAHARASAAWRRPRGRCPGRW